MESGMVFASEIWYTVKNSFGFNMSCSSLLVRRAGAVLDLKWGFWL